ncbi:facilitated trehalose transporter Tret1 [Plutella xylostella]|uniref:facilitated trehalose transporter Tret1 n=1 Tax=Plutella xylostella TaxID=51655 RepID=UPI0020324A2F|nr:facilitated trehalose transporter Tret1 [Plutella xylostella]
MLSLFNSFGPFLRQYVIVIIANLSLFGSGLGFAWTSPVLVKLANQTHPVYDRPITEAEGSWIVSVTFIGGFLSNFLAAYLVDRIGRKRTFLLAALPRIACYVVHYLATAAWMNYVGRFLGGFSDGLSFCVIPMYASEVASKEIRGALGTILQIFSSLGIVTMLSLGPFLQYRALNAACAVLCAASSAPLLLLPDSPYFLNKQGKIAEALKVLTFLRGSESLAKKEMEEYQTESEQTTLTLREVLTSKSHLKIIAIVVCIGAGAQLTGYNAVAFYLQTILVSTKTSVSSNTASVVIGVIQLVASFVTAVVIDRFGRKPILCSSLVGLSVGLAGLGTFFFETSSNTEIIGFWNYLPLVSILLAVFSFSLGLGSLMFPLMSELFDGKSRAIGMFFGLVSNIISIFAVTQTFASLTNAIGAGAVYSVYSVNSLLFCVFILYCVPETKGKTFAEIQRELGVGVANDESVRSKC